ncbi:MAG: signal recognition particle-docking protein FtsY [Oscillospiraceae bacterium]|nr:signal recognition particle-docking protein FtsY [Oscillospiraceae bacterium]
MGFFSKIAAGIKKTKDSIMGKFDTLLNSFTKIDEDFFEELEELLITCDIGVETSLAICSKLREKVKEKGLTNPADIKECLKDIITEMLGEDKTLDLSTTPSVVLIIGVNGAGKTTTIGKLAAKYKNQGKKVLVAAADTFRAAAIDQLQVWTERAGVDIVKHAEGSDPAAVVFDAVTAAKARGTDVLICDTAGRLHNKKNLMDELKKISRIIHEQGEGCSLETLLVLDATTGQNAVNQAKLFSEVADITGIVLTKLDGTAKGGIIISIHNELGIPVKLVGVGEKLDDLQEFNAREFAEALFSTENDFDFNYERLTDEEEKDEDESLIDEIREESSETIEEIKEFTEDVKEKTEDIIDEIKEEISETVEDIKDKLDGDNEEVSDSENEEEASDENVSDENVSDETSENAPKEKGGKFGWLFKEISFGKKNKDKKED